ncbi:MULTISPECIES: DUF6484 domain-containing protein [Massilia]|uniref:DUF6484 domain-containing protein n=1 Tax=Massilia frigida TaxID=2609281 RepID=A0ABX0NIQ0_9BURK|nr:MULTISPECIES: DUF6484 domain-containing protein [Massilia]MDQ1835436.1 DUF6484 domain-containing protein [Massilia sp. CCM 9029]MDQ1924640.1 DUF6484 domain-containing protein [Massilia sp. CCM 9206]NHZ83392.1 hypothetical protein [Massilia frigida]
MTATKSTRVKNIVAPDIPSTSTKHPCIASAAPTVAGLVIGTLTGLTEELACMVDFGGNPCREPLMARALVPLTIADIGTSVAILFEGSDLTKPVIMGRLFGSALQADVTASENVSILSSGALQVITNDNEVTLMASRKLTLKCGRASITLDVDGNVEIRGDNLLSRAAGQNRIKGSSVSLN